MVVADLAKNRNEFLDALAIKQEVDQVFSSSKAGAKDAADLDPKVPTPAS